MGVSWFWGFSQILRTNKIVRTLQGHIFRNIFWTNTAKSWKGHTVYTDSYFSSVRLYEELQEHGMDAVGTLTGNQIGFPSELKDKMLKKGGTSSVMKPLDPEGSSLMCMKYCDKKHIFWSVPGIKATLLTLKKRTPKRERRGKFASQLLYMSTMDQFMGCIAQQQMTMITILERLEHQQRVSEAQEVGTG